jgi:hypothetical protein
LAVGIHSEATKERKSEQLPELERNLTALSAKHGVYKNHLGEDKACSGRMSKKQASRIQMRASCTDQIATLRIILEQSLEWRSLLYINFVDFRKAFDMVDHNTLWRVLRHYGIPVKISNIMQRIYYDTRCQVIHNSYLSEPFKVITGVKQGCMLSPIIFTMVIDWIMKASINPPRGIQWTITSTLEDLDFADDISLLSHQLQQVQQKTDSFNQTANSSGLKINIDKTKNLRINAQQNDPIILNGNDIEDVSHFTYLGSI